MHIVRAMTLATNNLVADRQWSPRVWGILIVLCGALFLDALDVSMVGVALPSIRTDLGLSTASLIAFILGIGCIAGALLVGLLTAKNFVDWQAIQFYRAEWLLAATAAFVAGILLKKTSKHAPGDEEEGE